MRGPSPRAFFVVLLAALGCAAAPPHAAPQRVLLAPVSFHLRLPANLAPGVAPVGEELAQSLAARGVTILAPGEEAFREVWQLATQDVGTLTNARGELDPGSLDAAARALVAAWQARGERFDTLLLSYLEPRFVMILAGSVAWDGVERRVQIVRQVGKRLGNWPNHEQAPCVSLRVIAYGVDGVRRLDRSGGLEVLSDYVVRTFEERPRRELFADRSLLREGVEIALAPLFPDTAR